MSDDAFTWKRHPEAAAFVERRLARLVAEQPDAQRLERSLAELCGARLVDFLDGLFVAGHGEDETLASLGWRSAATEGRRVWVHEGSMLCPVVTGASEGDGLAVAVEELSLFLGANGLDRPVEGAPLSKLRRALISRHGGVGLWAVERRCRDQDEADETDRSRAMLDCLDGWRSRSRETEGEEAYDALEALLRRQIDAVGSDLAAWAFFRSEREFWETKNRAGRILGGLQRALGMGWANHDHHTFRSSRAHFHRLVGFARLLGFRLRERYYAGEEAGWGAQVVDHPAIGVACFLDVDLDPEERDLDFTSAPLPPSERLGTVGLWAALHGDGLIRGGLHHLAARGSFDGLVARLKAEGVDCMPAFSTFPHLHQAFTQGERRLVAPSRMGDLVAAGRLNGGQVEHFAARGALASHLEVIERNEGYMGFSKKEVSRIIRDTDPRGAGQGRP